MGWRIWMVAFLVVTAAVLGAVASAIASRENPETSVTLRVWQSVEDGSLWLSSRPEGGRWTRSPVPLDMSELSPSGRFRQSAYVTIPVPVELDGYFVEPTRLSGSVQKIDECTGDVPQIGLGEFVTGDGHTRWRPGTAGFVFTIPDGVTLWREEGRVEDWGWDDPVEMLHTGSVTLALRRNGGHELLRTARISYLAWEEDTVPSPHELAASIVASVRSTWLWESCSTYDPTGAVATPGSYAFLASNRGGGQDTAVMTTYEGLREGADTLRIHRRTSGGGSVHPPEPGDSIEWRESNACFVLYEVTSETVEEGERLQFGISPYAYSFLDCSGALRSIAMRKGAHFSWSPRWRLPVAVPFLHGPWLLVPEDWSGPLPKSVPAMPPATMRTHSLPSGPELGPGWTSSLARNEAGGLEGSYSYTDGGRLRVDSFPLDIWPYDVLRFDLQPYRFSESGILVINGLPARFLCNEDESLAVVIAYHRASGLMYRVTLVTPSPLDCSTTSLVYNARQILPHANNE
ncbi:MAG: hypothetical protein F4089_04755 [Gammaproteobacteria bacterium]|nr:hypothetical protein [Gammaproteobacteria bacterium]